MTYQDETQFTLDLIKDEWPDGFPDDVHRIHRGDSRVLETGNRRRKSEAWPMVNVISAALGDRDDEPRGAEYDLDVEQVVSGRAVAMHSSQDGQIDDFDEWTGFKNRIRAAITADRSYPAVEADNDLGYVCYQDLVIDDWTDLSNDYRDQYRLEFDIRLRGIEQLPDL